MHNVIDLAVEHGIITKAGSWYDYDGSRIGQGIDNVKAYFSEHPEIFEVLEQSVRQKIFNKEK